MSEPKERISPIRKVKAAFAKSPKSPTSDRINFSDRISFADKCTVTELNSRMEDIYFNDPKSRESLSTNPGDNAKHLAERQRCTTDNWKAEIERRIIAKSKMAARILSTNASAGAKSEERRARKKHIESLRHAGRSFPSWFVWPPSLWMNWSSGWPAGSLA
ncbi:uncharacterized protein A1O5_06302 [Cladophialophora psammophila CBS 110553]|uniref:Uncharacterized protein n=1 Tax=Cladophialophora psammophila CBS 110553 TaxID=1182543 RepID=W9XIP2_9EURO|nr:uncharacterized protein A1O5_06302 [Cladophialophora psammophila CBS 110553]EXJ70234.1 hypothetical protein A1O5_06302 [Cladophialophora psammophila CBS 110553]